MIRINSIRRTKFVRNLRIRQANEFFLFAGLMFVDMLLFMWLAYRYTPLGVVDYEKESTAELLDETADSDRSQAKASLGGIDNVAFAKEQQSTKVE